MKSAKIIPIIAIVALPAICVAATTSNVVSRSKGVWIVDSLFKHTSGLSIKIEWEVRDNGKGPRITDVRSANVSLLLTRRSEFNSYILNNGGKLESLVQELEVRVGRQ